MNETRESTSGTTTGFTEEERAAMRDRAKELRSPFRWGKADAEADVLAKIARMKGSDRIIAEKLHALVKSNAPDLTSKLWYGMPAYARNGKIVCFFQSAQKFKTRYATFGFNDSANLDDGTVWPSAYALMTLTAEDEARIGALIKRAVS